MIKPVSQLINDLLPMIPQEGGAQPGEGLTAIETITYFFVIPVVLFVVIGALSWFASAPKKQKSDVINQIPNDDNDNFITFIA
jgi:hypothetical protein